MEVYRIGNIEIKRDWKSYTINALPESGIDPSEINGTFARLHSLLSRVLPETDFKMRSYRQEHILGAAQISGLEPFHISSPEMMLGADPGDPSRQCKTSFSSILGGVFAGQIAHGVEQSLKETNVEAVVAELARALGQAKLSLPKLRALTSELPRAQVEIIEEFLGSTIGALGAAKKLQETVVTGQHNIHSLLAKAADVPNNVVLSPDELAASVAVQGSRINAEYISTRGDAGTRVHALIEAQMRQIKQSGVWKWDDSDAYAVAGSTAFDITRAKLAVERLQSDFGCIPEDILAIETAVLMPSLGATGTADMILRVGGKAVIVDWKTQKTMADTVAWQLAGYRSGTYWLLDDGVATVSRAKKDRHALTQSYRDQIEALLSAEPEDMPALRDQAMSTRQEMQNSTVREPVIVRMPDGQEYEVSSDALVVHLPAGLDETPVLHWYLVNIGDGVVDAFEELVQMANNADVMMSEFQGRGSQPLLRKIQPLQVPKVWQTTTRPEPEVQQVAEAKAEPKRRAEPKPEVQQVAEPKAKPAPKTKPEPEVQQVAEAKAEPKAAPKTKPEPVPVVQQTAEAKPAASVRPPQSDTQKRNVRASLQHYGATVLVGYEETKIEQAVDEIMATMNNPEQSLKMREAISLWVAQHDLSNLTVV